MKRAARCGLITIIVGLCPWTFARERATEVPPLKLVHSVALPGFTGDFDHFAVDLPGGRLFLAGEDHKSLEVFSLKTGEHLRSIPGLGTPHSILYLPAVQRLYVTEGDEGTLKILNGSDYSVLGKVQLVAGADSIGFDTTAQRLYVVTGGKDVPMDHSFLTAVDLSSGKTAGELRFDSNHVEAMALERNGPRLFINITDHNEIAVVDRKTMQVTARWPVRGAKQNSPIALDEAHHRLFVVCREPGTLVVLNTDTGQMVTSLPAAGHADDVAYDSALQRIYVPGGEGYISVYQQRDADHYATLAKVISAPGAKTALLVPELKRLFVAVSPGESKAPAQVLTFEVAR